MSIHYDHVALADTTGSIVFIRTLGALAAFKHGKALKWYGSGVGAHKLKRSFSYLLAHRDHPVSRERLIEIAKANAIVSGIRMMLRHWGLDDVLHPLDRRVVLMSHQSWSTDTDRLEQHLEAAQHCRSKNDLPGLLSALNQAEKLCAGDYLPDYDAQPEYSLESAEVRWRQCQKETLRAVAEARLAYHDHSLCAAAIAAAVRAIRFDQDNPDSYLFAAAIARRCGNEGLARLYELRAP